MPTTPRRRTSSAPVRQPGHGDLDVALPGITRIGAATKPALVRATVYLRDDLDWSFYRIGRRLDLHTTTVTRYYAMAKEYLAPLIIPIPELKSPHPSALDITLAIMRLHDEHGADFAVIADRLGMTEADVRRRYRASGRYQHLFPLITAASRSRQDETDSVRMARLIRLALQLRREYQVDMKTVAELLDMSSDLVKRISRFGEQYLSDIEQFPLDDLDDEEFENDESDIIAPLVVKLRTEHGLDWHRIAFLLNSRIGHDYWNMQNLIRLYRLTTNRRPGTVNRKRGRVRPSLDPRTIVHLADKKNLSFYEIARRLKVDSHEIIRIYAAAAQRQQEREAKAKTKVGTRAKPKPKAETKVKSPRL